MMLFHDPLFVLPGKLEARWINPENINGAKGSGGKANGGRKGAACYGAIKAGAQIELANYQGSSGIIRHIWTTIDNRSPKMLRGLRMDFYWDGSDRPAISAPWGDFFGCGLVSWRRSSALFSTVRKAGTSTASCRCLSVQDSGLL